MKGFLPSVIRGRAWGCIAACGLAVALLMSCGGQTSAPPPKDEPVQNGAGLIGAGGGGTPSLAIAGAYKDSSGNRDFVSFLTPSGAWYGVYFLTTSSIYPDIYTGKVTTTSESAATIDPMVASQSGGNVSTGKAAISGASSLAYQIELLGISLANGHVPSLSPSFVRTLTGIAGDWLGDLKDSKSVADHKLTLGFSETGSLIRGGGYDNCTLALELTPQMASTEPYYSANLQISGEKTLCHRVHLNNGATVAMTGIALIYDSPLPDRTKRLEIILTDSTGSGIYFRGDQ